MKKVTIEQYLELKAQLQKEIRHCNDRESIDNALKILDVAVVVTSEKHWNSFKECPKYISYKGRTLKYRTGYFGSNSALNKQDELSGLEIFIFADGDGVGWHMRYYEPLFDNLEPSNNWR